MYGRAAAIAAANDRPMLCCTTETSTYLASQAMAIEFIMARV